MGEKHFPGEKGRQGDGEKTCVVGTERERQKERWGERQVSGRDRRGQAKDKQDEGRLLAMWETENGRQKTDQCCVPSKRVSIAFLNGLIVILGTGSFLSSKSNLDPRGFSWNQ